MSEQRVPARIRIHDSIDQDVMDAKMNLNLIEKLAEQEKHPQTCIFSEKERETLMRNCVHTITLNLTKTIEKPTIYEEKIQTFNLESLIDSVCHDEDKKSLREELCKMRGNKIYGKLVEYRHKIIAHRNIEYASQQAIKQVFQECKDYLLKNRGGIEKLVNRIGSLQMDIKDSRDKKRGLPSNSSSDSFAFTIVVP